MKYIKRLNIDFNNWDETTNLGYSYPSDGEDLKIVVGNSYFEGNNYIFQKLYAADYPVYHKEIENYHIWCWVDTKDIEINGWYNYTKKIVEYYLENRNNLKKSKSFKDYEYLHFYFNLKTGEIIDVDIIRNNYFKKGDKGIIEYYESEYETTNKWSKIIITKEFDKVIDELKRISDL